MGDRGRAKTLYNLIFNCGIGKAWTISRSGSRADCAMALEADSPQTVWCENVEDRSSSVRVRPYVRLPWGHIYPSSRPSLPRSFARSLARPRQVDLEKSGGMDAPRKAEGRKKEAVKDGIFAMSQVRVTQGRAASAAFPSSQPFCLIIMLCL